MSPEAEAIACAWWDEGRGWTPGVSSGVLADKLEEEEAACPDTLHWLRCTFGPSIEAVGFAGVTLIPRLDRAANVHRISGGTTADPRLKHMFDSFWVTLRYDRGYSSHQVVAEAWVLLGEDTAHMIGRSRECREWVMQDLSGWRQIKEEPYSPLKMLGLPDRMYGWRLLLNDAQPRGQVDCILGDTIITARVC